VANAPKSTKSDFAEIIQLIHDIKKWQEAALCGPRRDLLCGLRGYFHRQVGALTIYVERVAFLVSAALPDRGKLASTGHCAPTVRFSGGGCRALDTQSLTMHSNVANMSEREV
jgi:hypothetical protein